MLSTNTSVVARPVAEQITDNYVRLQPKSPNYPLAVLLDHYTTPALPEGLAEHPRTTAEDVLRLTEAFDAFNRDVSDNEADEFETVVDNMVHGLESLLVTARTVIVPACRRVVEATSNAGIEDDHTPLVEINPVRLHAVHRNVAVTNIVKPKLNLDQRYTTPRLGKISDEKTRECMRNSPTLSGHVDDFVNELDFGRLSEIRSYFERSVLELSQVGFLSRQSPFEEADIALGVFLLADHLYDNPIGTNHSMTLAEWQESLYWLKHLAAHGLYRQYTEVARIRQEGQVVVSTENLSQYAVRINVNGDTIDAFYQAGGDIKVLVGAVYQDPNAKTQKRLMDKADTFRKAGERRYFQLKQAASDNTFIRKRNLFLSVVEQLDTDDDVTLPEVSHMDLKHRLAVVRKQIRENDMTDIWRLATKYVCEVYYPGKPYHHYFHAMDRLGKQNPDCSPREIANLATREMLSQWLISQVSAEALTTETLAAIYQNTAS